MDVIFSRYFYDLDVVLYNTAEAIHERLLYLSEQERKHGASYVVERARLRYLLACVDKQRADLPRLAKQMRANIELFQPSPNSIDGFTIYRVV